MDKSKKYIEMCEKAEEIQQTWECDDGDFMAAPVRENEDFQERDKGQDYVIWVVCDYYSAACYNGKEKRQDHPQAHESYFDEYSDTFRNFDGGDEWENKLIAKRKDCIYLPRQDQLQETWLSLKPKNPLDNTLEEKINAFIYWLWGGRFDPHYYSPEYSNFDSMEQLWLAFVMSGNYNKTWNGKEWVKQ